MNFADAFCRTCMHQFEHNSIGFVKSYDIFQVHNLAQKLEQCSNLPVKPFDEYPRLICEKCYERIMEYCNFQKMCRESLSAFLDILSLEKSTENYTGTLDDCSSPPEKPNKQSIPESDISKTFETDDFIVEEIIKTEFIETECEQTGVIGRNSKVIDGLQHEDNEILTSNLFECVTNQIDHLEEYNSNSRQESLNDPNDSEEECGVDTLLDDNDEYDQGTTINGKYPYHCDLCPKVFAYEHCLTAHIRRHKGLRPHPCNREKCTRAFSRLSDLHQHLREHDGYPREIYKCDVDNCGKEFKTKSSINWHMRMQHNFSATRRKRKLTCNICDAVISDKRSLQYHLLGHVDKSLWPFGCNWGGCTSRFRRVEELKAHINRHAGNKPYVCPHCDQRFYRASHLRVHINSHTGEKKYPCKTCSRVFLSRSKLSYHAQKEHNRNGQPLRYPCRMCDKQLSTSTARKYHEQTHTGEKPYICEQCGRGFTRPSVLSKHKITHLDLEFREKAYECVDCGKKFGYHTSLQRHRKNNICQNFKKHTKREVIGQMESSEIDVVGE